jgi:hypothetical protein
MQTIYYYPQNRWMFRGVSKTNFKPIEIKISSVTSSVSSSIFLRQGSNELTEERADLLKSNKSLTSFFEEGSLVWHEDKKFVTPIDKQSSKTSELPVIEEVFQKIQSSGTSEELEEIIKTDKRKEVLEAVKLKLAEIKKASVGS